MSDNTLIQLKKSTYTFEELKANHIEYGEPVFIEPDENDKNSYLIIGNSNDNNTVENATFFNGYTDKDLLGKSVFYTETPNSYGITKDIVDKDKNYVSTKQVTPKQLTPSVDEKNVKYYVLLHNPTVKDGHTVYTQDCNAEGIYITGNGVFHGGAWNDYAENRIVNIDVEYGTVVCENGDGTLSPSTKKLQPIPYVVSDTAGSVIGDKSGVPIGLAGRVLVKVNCDVELGDVLCADKDGYATKMTRNEVANYPDRILGIVSEIPTYDKWKDIEVNDRVWLTIK